MSVMVQRQSMSGGDNGGVGGNQFSQSKTAGPYRETSVAHHEVSFPLGWMLGQI